MQQTDVQLSQYYAVRAREYEQIYDKPERQSDLARLKDLIPRYFAARNVLEIACGTGYWTQFIAPVAGKVTAIDINPETLAIARTKPYPSGRVRFDVADINALPPELSNFTAAFAGFWWSHVPRAGCRALIESLDKALSPGAVVVVLDNRYVEAAALRFRMWMLKATRINVAGLRTDRSTQS
jgi:ubiquinone/menaquinone biosynthesis C-methylase UbiE